MMFKIKNDQALAYLRTCLPQDDEPQYQTRRIQTSRQHDIHYLWDKESKESVNPSRLRMALGGVNAHCKHYHFIKHSSCPKCHVKKEETVHFFFELSGLHCP